MGFKTTNSKKDEFNILIGIAVVVVVAAAVYLWKVKSKK